MEEARSLRNRWAVAAAAALLVACSGGDDGTEQPARETLDTTTPAVAPTATSTTPTTTPTASSSATTQATTESPSTSITPASTDVIHPENWEPIDAFSAPWLGFVSSRTGTTELFVVDLDSGVERQLTEIGDVYQPAWSPDGSMIAFQCPRAGSLSNEDVGLGPSDICAIVLESGEILHLTDDDVTDQGPQWSPDGSQVAFQSIEPEGMGSVRVVEIGTDDAPRQLAAGLGPAWAPDGSKLAAVVPDASTGLLPGTLTLIDPTTGDRADIADDMLSSLDWSPDGSAIAATCAVKNAPEEHLLPPSQVCVVALDGSSSERLSDEEGSVNGPLWSPNGELIAYTAIGAFGGPSVTMVVPVDHSDTPRQITIGSVVAWSRDGARLVVVDPETGIHLVDPSTAEGTLAVMDPSAVGGVTWAPDAPLGG